MLERDGVGEEMSRRVFLKLSLAGMSGAAALFVSACGAGEEEDEEEEEDD